jgi:Rieske Fe-S protein
VIKGDVVLTRSGSTVHGFSATCTHQGCTVNQVSDGTIDCPCHGSKFDAATGAVVTGPAPAPLPPVRVTVRNGEVFSG